MSPTTRPPNETGRVARLVRATGALAVLAILVLGVPLALAHYVGWPLPHRVPSLGQLRNGLTRDGVPSSLVIKALAVVCWVAWASLVVSVATEVASLVRGRAAHRLRLAGPLQSLVAVLVAAIALGFTTPIGRAADTLAPLHLALAARSPSPAQTLVLNHEELARFTGPPHIAVGGAPSTAQTSGPATAPATAPTTTDNVVTPSPGAGALPGDQAPAATLYVVRRGDTLWSIAQDALGDPLRWRQIYALNEGRLQPGGAVLDDPHWIYPGWTLVLPTSTHMGTSQAPQPAASPPTAPQTPAPVAPLAPPPSVVPAPSASVSPGVAHIDPNRPVPAASPQSAPEATTARHGAEVTQLPVEPASGSLIAGSFAAGVLSAVALGRLRRRHRYRYRPPRPGLDLTPEPSRPTLRHLARVADGRHDDDGEQPATDTAGTAPDATGASAVPALVFDDAERRQHPGHLEIAARNGATVTLDVTDLTGMAIIGPATDDIARALVAGLVVRAGPRAAEVLLTAELAVRLLPGLAADRSIRRAATLGDAARAVEVERIARARRLDAAGVPDAASFRAEHPENPLPSLLVLADGLRDDLMLDGVAPDARGRWAALAVGSARLGIAVVFLGDSPAATARLVTDPTRTVTGADPPLLAERLGAAQLFGLRAEEAVELLGSVIEAIRAGDDSGGDDVGEDSESSGAATVVPLGDRGERIPSPSDRVEGPWPETSAGVSEGTPRPLAVEILGPYRITAFGEAVTSGLRARARALLAWYLVRPEGATAEEAVDALWPETGPDAVLKQFWRALGDLRAGLRSQSGETPEVLEKAGSHYRPCQEEICCDLWELQAALAEAARAGNDETARQALCRAVETYRGDLLAGDDGSWVEPVREDLHRRAIDAHLRLAELDEHAGRYAAAVATLERAIDLDCYAEEPYRRLMTLQAACGRPDALSSTWRLLGRRLAELDVDMEEATARLYRRLTAAEQPGAPHPVRLSS